MTCIVALKYNNKIWMGGDSAASTEDFTCQRDDAKVFKREGYLIGITTSFRMRDLLKYKLKLPKCKINDVTKFMAVDFIDAVKECFRDNNFGGTSEAGSIGGSFLVGYKNNLYHIDSDYQVAVPKDNFYAIGSGAYIAFGALYAANEYGANAEEILNVALESASKYSTSVSAPFTIIHS